MGTRSLTLTEWGLKINRCNVIWRVCFLVATSERAEWGNRRWPGRGSVYLVSPAHVAGPDHTTRVQESEEDEEGGAAKAAPLHERVRSPLPCLFVL